MEEYILETINLTEEYNDKLIVVILILSIIKILIEKI